MRHNPWTTRLLALGVFSGFVLLVSLLLNTVAGESIYAEPSGGGVILPAVAKAERRVVEAPKPEAPVEQETYERRLRFRVAKPEVDPASFVSLTRGVTARVVSVRPITQTKRDDRGKSLMLLIDNSYSMIQPSPPSPWNEDWLPRADPEYKRIEAVSAVLDSLGPNDRVALATFPRLNPTPGYRIPRVEPPALMKSFATPGEVKQVVEGLRGRENSGTPLFRSLRLAIQWMAQETDRPRIAIMLTDGRDTESETGVPEGLRDALVAAGIQVIVVALGPAPDLESLRQVADEVIPVSESSMLVPTFRRIAERMETSTIGFDVVLDVLRRDADFAPGENVAVGFRSGERPERISLRVDESQTATPSEEAGPPAPASGQVSL